MLVYLVRETDQGQSLNPQNQVAHLHPLFAKRYAQVRTLELRKKCGCEYPETTELPPLLDSIPEVHVGLANEIARGTHSQECSSLQQVEIWAVPYEGPDLF